MSTTDNSPTTTTSSDYQEEEQEHMAFAKGFMTIVYLTVCLIGTPGNIWIIYKLFRAKLWSTSSVQLTVSQRSRIYIFALACSDLILLLTLPATSSYNYYGTWIFGGFACYMIRSIEIFAKLFSVVLLTVMSLERYFIVCTRLRLVYRAWMSLVPLLIGFTFGVAIPTVFHLLYLQHFQLSPALLQLYGITDEESTWLCLPMMGDGVFNMFAQYTFFVGFVIPFMIMTACYILLVSHVKKKYKIRRRAQATTTLTTHGKEPRYMSEVRKSIWRIAVFHFVCWAPFWGSTMLPHYISFWDEPEPNETDHDERESLLFVYCRLFANCLPYINAAGNWVLYALLNVDVRKHIYNQPAAAAKNKKKKRLRFQPMTSSL
ncbi:unnamed protein product [Caenorhabditis bovis]|uniref:G-protein coupled receptors family 1 profile domain-containing protein n=1 Tax=Caenorhabditis bovis TaxID=2654633 RepID=A0A8S1EXK0_9PELO|nr:unnamed protein product [Caenorhabditis bovis]